MDYKLILCTFILAVIGAHALNIPDSLVHMSATAKNMRKKVLENGCDPNICFALDGSRSISSADYILEKDFVQLVASIVSADPDGTYSAVQYGFGLERISSPTADIDSFLDDVEFSTQLQSKTTFLAPAINFCIRALGKSRFKGEPKKIVLLGDGGTNYDSRRYQLSPAKIIRQWKKQSSAHSASAVAVNFKDISMWKPIVGGRNHVFRVTEWLELVDVLADLVVDICGWDKLDF